MLVQGSVMGSAGAGLIIVYLAILIASIVGTVKIVSKAGYSGWFVLLAFVPFVNVVMFFVFAFSDWPVQKELRQYRQGGYGTGVGGYPGPAWPNQPPPGYGQGYNSALARRLRRHQGAGRPLRRQAARRERRMAHRGRARRRHGRAPRHLRLAVEPAARPRVDSRRPDWCATADRPRHRACGEGGWRRRADNASRCHSRVPRLHEESSCGCKPCLRCGPGTQAGRIRGPSGLSSSHRS